MKTKIIYYINLIINLVASVITILKAVQAIINGGALPLSIVFSVVSLVFIAIIIFCLIKISKSFFADPKWSLIISIICSVLGLVYSCASVLFYSPYYFFAYAVETFLSVVIIIFILLKDDGKIRYNHLKRATTKSPTMTIQISNEFLVKDSYTPEEAQKTLEQLYSIHDANGFSLEEYNKLKDKITKNIKND